MFCAQKEVRATPAAPASDACQENIATAAKGLFLLLVESEVGSLKSDSRYFAEFNFVYLI